MHNSKVRFVVSTGIGAALFVVLSFVSIPTGIPNTSLETRVALLAFFAAVFGPVVGGLVGFIGHALADAIQYGGVWWSWVIADAIFGVLVGLFAHRWQIEQGNFGKKQIISFNVIQVIANAICWCLIAPVLDILIYAEPSNKVFTQGIIAAIANSISIAILTTLLATAYSKTKAKSSSLSKEDDQN